MELGMLFENFKNYYILRYDIYDFFKLFRRGPDRPVWLKPSVLCHTMSSGRHLETYYSMLAIS